LKAEHRERDLDSFKPIRLSQGGVPLKDIAIMVRHLREIASKLEEENKASFGPVKSQGGVALNCLAGGLELASKGAKGDTQQVSSKSRAS
jgi:hypothetical protein